MKRQDPGEARAPATRGPAEKHLRKTTSALALGAILTALGTFLGVFIAHNAYTYSLETHELEGIAAVILFTAIGAIAAFLLLAGVLMLAFAGARQRSRPERRTAEALVAASGCTWTWCGATPWPYHIPSTIGLAVGVALMVAAAAMFVVAEPAVLTARLGTRPQ
ncbi:MAG: hypothetical protein V4510_08535 [bacterium]